MANEQRNKQLANLVIQAHGYYSADLSKSKLAMFVEDFNRMLGDVPVETIAKACFAYRGNPKNKFVWVPAQIHEIIHGPPVSDRDQAKEIANRIIGAVSKFGYSDAKGAREFIGEVGWDVLKGHGGWFNFCEGLRTNQIPMLTAQFRDLIEARLKTGWTTETNMNALPSSAEERKQLESVNDMVGKLASAKSIET